MNSRTLSVYPETQAVDFIKWLTAVWDDLLPSERHSATMEVRPHDDVTFIGLRWHSLEK
jgi:hypothetical protein